MRLATLPDKGFHLPTSLLISKSPSTAASQIVRGISIVLCAAFLLMPASAGSAKDPQQAPEKIEEINKEFHFLGPDDTVLIHEEDGKLKGQVDVYAGEEESDIVLSYALTIGTRTGDHVEFKTAKVHEKHFRFSGAIQRGAGRKEQDADYLRLVGNLETVTMNGMTGNETSETKQVVLKSLSADEIEEEN